MAHDGPDNPSSGGITAKESVGRKGKAANMYGWDLWKALDPGSPCWVSISHLCAAKAAPAR